MKTTINNGGPAFPRFNTGITRPNDPDGEWFERQNSGMTLRQWYAGQAMLKFCYSATTEDAYQKIAKDCFQMADAMIREGEKNE